MDISVFAKDEYTPTAFVFRAYFDDGSLTLWEGTTTNDDVGYTLPKKVYEIPYAPRTLLYLEVTSNRSDHYFVLWGGGGVVNASNFKRPNVSISAPTLVVPYAVTDIPFVLPNIQITNETPASECGDIEWFISSTPSVANGIANLSIYQPSTASMRIRVVGPIAYTTKLYVTARNTDGFISQKSFNLRTASTPIINNPGLQTASLTTTNFTRQFTIASDGTGPVTWYNSTVAPPPALSIQSNTGIVTFQKNNYLLRNITISASNAIGSASSVIVPFHIAQTPQIQTPASITASMGDPNADFIYQGITQTASGTGNTLTWSIPNNPFPSQISIDNQPEVTFKYGVYVKRPITFMVANDVGGTSSNSVFVHVAPDPVMTQQPDVVYNNNSSTDDFYLQVPHQTPADIPLIWSLSPSNVDGLTISPTLGQIRVENGLNIDRVVTVTASNELGAFDSTSFRLSVASVPIIVNPGSVRYSMSNANFTYQMQQIATGTGALDWSISPSHPGLTINSFGLITVSSDRPITDTVTVSVANRFGGTASTSFLLDVTQIPLISNPGNIVASTLQEDFTYALTTTTTPQAGTLWWIVETIPSNLPFINSLSIQPSTGLITFAKDAYIDHDVRVSASNVRGDVATSLFHMKVASTPRFISPGSLVASLRQLQAFTYRFQEVSVGTGGTVWDVTDTNDDPIPHLTINNSGLLQYSAFASLNTTIKVSATNIVDTVTSSNVPINFVITPEIDPPPELVFSTTTTPYTYANTLQYNVPVQWSIQSTVPAVVINQSTGVVTVPTNTHVFEFVDVTASNEIGGFDTVEFFLNVSQTPSLSNPGTIVRNLHGPEVFSYSVSQSAVGTGPLTWNLTPEVQGLSIDTATGLILLDRNTAVDAMLNVRAQNRAAGRDDVSFSLTVCRNPVVQNPALLRASMAFNTNYTYQFIQEEVGTGVLTWSLLNSSIPGTSLSSDGLLTVQTGTYVNEPQVTVATSNIAGGGCNVTFQLQVAQDPYFVMPLIVNGTTTTQDFQYSINQQALGTGPLGWWIDYTEPTAGDSGPLPLIDQTGVITSYMNCNINRAFTVYASNQFGGRYGFGVRFTVAQEPVIVNPGLLLQNYASNTEINYQYPLTQTAIGTGQLTWSIGGDANFSPIQGLTISSAGVISHTTYAIDRTIYIGATNPAGGCNIISFPLSLARTPLIQNPGVVTGTTTQYVNFTYPMQVIDGYKSGNLTWSITRADSPTLNGLSIGATTGIITFTYLNMIDTNVTVSASNVTGGVANATFRLQVAQTPVVQVPGSILASVSLNQNHTYQAVNLAAYSGAVTWSVRDSNLNPISGISINSSGLITFPANTFIDRSIRITATNALGASNTTPAIPVIIARTPILNPINNITSNLSASIPFNVQASASLATSQTGPLTWSLGAPVPAGLSISSSGLITLDANSSIQSQVTVRATNSAGGSSNVSFQMAVYQLPSITLPPTNQRFRTRENDYRYTMTQSVLRANPVTWSITPPLPTGLSINSTSGEIILARSNALTGTITVNASNMIQGVTSLAFDMNILQTPVIDFNLTSIGSSYHPADTPYTYQMIQTAQGTGTLTWDIRGVQGIALPSSLSIDRSSGLITVAPNSLVNTSVFVVVNNAYTNDTVRTADFNIRVSPMTSITGVTATAVSSNQVSIAWADASYLNTIELSNLTTQELFQPTDVRISPYIVQGQIEPNTKYVFRVTPKDIFNGSGCNVLTNEVYTLASSAGVVSISDITSNAANVAWQSYIGRSAQLSWGGTNVVEVSSNVLSSNIQGLSPNTTYQFSVTPLNAVGMPSVASLSPQFITLPYLSNVATNSHTASNVGLVWTPNAQMNAYSNVLVSWNQDNKVITSNVIGMNTFNIQGLAQNTLYNFTLTPFNSSNISGQALSLPVTTKTSISPLVVTTMQGGSFIISWERGNYAYAVVSWTGTSSNSQVVTGNSVNITLQGTDEDITFVVTTYNSNNQPGQSRSVRVAKRDDVILWFDNE